MGCRMVPHDAIPEAGVHPGIDRETVLKGAFKDLDMMHEIFIELLGIDHLELELLGFDRSAVAHLSSAFRLGTG